MLCDITITYTSLVRATVEPREDAYLGQVLTENTPYEYAEVEIGGTVIHQTYYISDDMLQMGR